MASIFEKLWRLAPAAFVLKAIVAAALADGLLLAFILLRRTYRKRYFTRRDTRVFELRQKWDALVSGEIPYEAWRKNPFDRRIVERSEEHTSELQSRLHLVCRLLLEKKKKKCVGYLISVPTRRAGIL